MFHSEGGEGAEHTPWDMRPRKCSFIWQEQMGVWEALKEQECGDVVLGQIGRALKNM